MTGATDARTPTDFASVVRHLAVLLAAAAVARLAGLNENLLFLVLTVASAGALLFVAGPRMRLALAAVGASLCLLGPFIPSPTHEVVRAGGEAARLVPGMTLRARFALRDYDRFIRECRPAGEYLPTAAYLVIQGTSLAALEIRVSGAEAISRHVESLAHIQKLRLDLRIEAGKPVAFEMTTKSPEGVGIRMGPEATTETFYPEAIFIQLEGRTCRHVYHTSQVEWLPAPRPVAGSWDAPPRRREPVQ